MVTLLLAERLRSISVRSGRGRAGEGRVARRRRGHRAVDAPSRPRSRPVFWWTHVLLILTFLNYLPYSKHLHVVTSLINVYLSNTSGPGRRA